ncbi:hypothetical protein TNCV_2240861 [Trichonephila clavipes]|nr:hypothetical protein TNCV_2240861 [Trichonephila clavipes]
MHGSVLKETELQNMVFNIQDTVRSVSEVDDLMERMKHALDLAKDRLELITSHISQHDGRTEKTEDPNELNETSPPILVRKKRHQRTQRENPSNLGERAGDKKANSTRQALQSWCVKTTTGMSNLYYSNLGLVIDPKKGGLPPIFGLEDFG